MKKLQTLVLLLVGFLFLVGCPANQSPPGTQTTITNGEALGVILFGDYGTGEPDQFEVARGMERFCKSKLCSLALLLGDNFYPAGVTSASDPIWNDRFEKPYGPLQLPFYASLGNHDYNGNVPAQIQYSSRSRFWKMPARYYEFIQGNVDFFAIDTNQFDATQSQWLREKLGTSTSLWKVVYGHHPVFSYGQHGNTPELVGSLLPILKGKVDFYICGHDHDKQVLASDGITFVVSGAAAQLRSVNSGPLTIYSKSTLGFSYLRFEKNVASLRMLNKDGAEDFTTSVSK